jgi:hypothetical protein
VREPEHDEVADDPQADGDSDTAMVDDGPHARQQRCWSRAQGRWRLTAGTHGCLLKNAPTRDNFIQLSGHGALELKWSLSHAPIGFCYVMLPATRIGAEVA